MHEQMERGMFLFFCHGILREFSQEWIPFGGHPSAFYHSQTKNIHPPSASQGNFGFQKRACDEGCVRRGVRGEVLEAQPMLHLRHIPHNLSIPSSAFRSFERGSKDICLHPREFLSEHFVLFRALSKFFFMQSEVHD